MRNLRIPWILMFDELGIPESQPLCRPANIKSTSWRREMYALSDFLIMVFVMVSEAVT